MISLNSITVEFGGDCLLDNVSFLINKTDKIGLVGRNGSGKTTLMRLITDIQKPASGNIEKPKGLKIGYLPQEKKFKDNNSVFGEAILAFNEILSIRSKISLIEEKLENASTEDENILSEYFEKLNALNERYSLLDGTNIEMKTERILIGLGFERSEFESPINSLSEGWQMRVELAKILLTDNDILLLDEPNNHLDIESIEWLENYLINYNGAVLLVSHDKLFLDRVTERTVEINFNKLFDYPVSYSKYTELREEQIELQKKKLTAQQKEIEQVESFIRRFRYKATKAKQVQSKIKMLDKIERINVDEKDAAEIHFSFPDCKKSGKVIAEGKGISKKYGSKSVLQNIDFLISSGEKIAFVGKNGQGKTTLSRIIVGEIDFEGDLITGYNVIKGYFPQNAGKLLKNELTVLETVEETASDDYKSKVRSILGNFLFTGDDVYKKTSVLSGGEKSRLVLASLMCSPSNFMILDEPTNHLDMLSKEVLKYALLNYKGTLIIVSHDREFLEGLTNKTFYFTNNLIKQYPGTLNEFLHIKKISDIKELENTNKIKNSSDNNKTISDTKIKYQKKKEDERNVRIINNKLLKLEKEIEELEQELTNIEEKINNIHLSFSTDELKFFTEEYAKIKSILEKKIDEWIVCGETLKQQNN